MTRARELSKLGNAYVFTVDSSNNLGIGSLTPDAKLDVAGIISATSFSGSGANLSGIVAGSTLSAGSGAQRAVVTSLTSGTLTTAATDADLSWNSTTNTLSATTLSGNITGTAATFSGDVSVGGTLTYDDVTNVDSVGVITARTGIKVGAGESISAVSGTLTYYGDGSNLTGVELGTKNFVASGTISNGATVVINTDGTVGIVTQTGDPASAGTSDVFESTETQWTSATYDPDNGKVVIAYQKHGGSYTGEAVVGTVTGVGITFGTPVNFAGNISYIKSTYDTNSNRVVIAYKAATGDYGWAIVGTVSGDTISFGTAVAFNSAITVRPSIAYDSTNSKVVIAYRDYGNSNYGTARVGTVSGTSISFGNAAVFESAYTDYTSVAFDSTNGKVVIAYTDSANSDYGTAIVGTVSGTDITFGNAVIYNSAASYNSSPVYDPDNGKVVIFYNGNSNYGTAIVGTVSGTDITFGTAVDINSTNWSNISPHYDTANNKLVISYGNDSNSRYGTVIEGTVSGTSISFGTPFVVNSNNSSFSSSAYDSTNEKLVMSYWDGGNSDYGTAKVYSSSTQVTNLTSENYIGIAGEAISNAATGKISVVGGVNSGQSGLTTAQTYYVAPTGILTTTADTPSVVAGTSISDTKILVWRS